MENFIFYAVFGDSFLPVSAKTDKQNNISSVNENNDIFNKV